MRNKKTLISVQPMLLCTSLAVWLSR